jgi:ABC-2 type transport system ATP-binding protein
MPVPAIEVKRLVKVYREGIRALDELSLTVPQGSIFGLLGPNGAGKSTLLKILTTLVRATSGSASVLGIDVHAHPLAVRRSICVVLQQNAVEQFLSVRDNLRTYGRFQHLDRGRIDERSERVMDLFGLSEERDRKVIDLSGGFKRRVQVAKVFMSDAPVIFLDEATTGMDPINKRATLEAIAAEAKRGRTIFLTTHILDEAEQLCDSIMFIDKGRALVEGDLYAIKAMARQIFEVSVTFDALTDELRGIALAVPHRALEFVGTTVVLKVDAAVVAPSEVIAMLSRAGSASGYEVRGASLEDIFVQLLGEGGGDA